MASSEDGLLEKTRREARALRLIARAERLARLSRLASIEPLLGRASQLASDAPVALARILSVRVSLARQRGETGQALLLAREASEALGDAGDVATAIAVRIEIGLALLGSGNNAEALQEGLAVLGQVETIENEARRREITGEAWRLLANVYLNLEQFDQAIHFCKLVIDGAAIDGDDVLAGAAFDCMACAYGAMASSAEAAGQHVKASELLERSLTFSRQAMSLAQRAGHRYNEATALANIADGLVQSGRPDEALTLMETWRMDPVHDLPKIKSHHFDTHGSICMALGWFDEAIVLFMGALETATQSNLALDACEHLANAYERIGDLASALEHYKRFHALFKEAASQAAQRSASTAAIYLETSSAIARADHHRDVAEQLQRSNEQLIRNADDLIVLSRRDPLTGLPNRRVMEEILSTDHAGLGIVMIDVDHFKKINDGWSHLIGDAVLRQVASLIRSCCRDVDTPVRYGGDEFAVMLPHTDAGRTLKVAQRVRDVIQSFDWATVAADLAVSVSVGCSVGSGIVAAKSILADADRSLYDAKRDGRNRVSSGAMAT